MKNYHIAIVSLVLSLFVLIGCDKKEQANLNDSSSKMRAPAKTQVVDGMLVFATIDEFLESTREIFDLSEKERAAWEKSLGFKSFGKDADDFYNNIDFSIYKSYDDMIQSLEANDLIDVYITVDKDTSYLQKDYDMPERYVMNTNRMYIIDNVVYKHFSNDTLVTIPYNNQNMSNINALAKSTDFTQFVGNTAFNISSAVVYQSPSSPVSTTIICKNKEFPPAYYNTGSNWNQKFRSRLIIKSKIRVINSDGVTNVCRNRITYTLVNEKYDRWWLFWYHYWWNNTAYYVNGKIVLSTAYKYTDPYGNGRLTGTDQFTVNFTNDFIETKTQYFDRNQYQAMKANAPAPELGFSGWNVDLTISSGVHMQYNQ